MHKIYTAADPIFVGYLRSLLEDRGIQCLVRNELLQGGAGELPPNECWPELWIIDPRDETLARDIIDNTKTPQARAAWVCHVCGESAEGQFSACWSCGSQREID